MPCGTYDPLWQISWLNTAFYFYIVLALSSTMTKLPKKTLIFHEFQGPTIVKDLPGLENEILKFQVFHDLYEPWLTSISKSWYLDNFFLNFAEVLLSYGTALSMSMHLLSFLFLWMPGDLHWRGEIAICPSPLINKLAKFCIRIVFWFLSGPL